MSKYGFYTEEYKEGFSIETLMTGDGKSQFAECIYDDGTVSISMSYDNGIGGGVGVKTEIGRTMDEEMGVRWQVKFESQASIDAMIETLLRAKNALALK
tara:strand:- start:2115 stop:2411 length:297 start_codon:yes stop_codon:yes gene_type:complete